MTPNGLRLLAAYRAIGQSPELAIIVTDDWRYVQLAEDIGALAIFVKTDSHAADWSPLAGLNVIYVPREGDTAESARMYRQLWSGRPRSVKALLEGELTTLFFSRAAA